CVVGDREYGGLRNPPASCDQPTGGAVGRQPEISCHEGNDAFRLAQLHSELQSRQDVLTFEVLIVGQNLLGGHPGAQQLKDRLHRVAQTTDRRLPVADFGVDDDAIEETHAHLQGRHNTTAAAHSTFFCRLYYLGELSEEG